MSAADGLGDALKQEVADLKAEVAGLDRATATAFARTERQIGELQARADVLEGRCAVLDGRVTKLGHDLGSLIARVTQGVEHPLSPEEPGHMAEAIEGEDAT